MTKITPSKQEIQIEEVQYTAGVSEGTFRKMGSAVNYASDSTDELVDNTEHIVSTPGSYNWTCPENVTKIRAQIFGGGGGGGYATFPTGSDGGAGGGAIVAEITVVPTTVYSITVGAGGTGGASGGSPVGTSGGTSSFNGEVSAVGGAPGNTAGSNSAQGYPSVIDASNIRSIISGCDGGAIVSGVAQRSDYGLPAGADPGIHGPGGGGGRGKGADGGGDSVGSGGGGGYADGVAATTFPGGAGGAGAVVISYFLPPGSADNAPV